MIHFTIFDDGISAMDIIGTISLLSIVTLITYAHFNRRNPINLVDILVDQFDNGKRRITRSALAAFIGMIAGTFAFLYSLTTGGLQNDWAGITGFMAAMFGYRISDKVFGGGAGQSGQAETPPVEPANSGRVQQ